MGRQRRRGGGSAKLQGKELSYNNLSTWMPRGSWTGVDQPAVTIIKQQQSGRRSDRGFVV